MLHLCSLPQFSSDAFLHGDALAARRFKYPVEFPAGNCRRIDIDPGDSAPMFRIPFSIRKHHYLEGTEARITVRVVAGERAVCKEELAIAITLNAERIKFYQGQT